MQIEPRCERKRSNEARCCAGEILGSPVTERYRENATSNAQGVAAAPPPHLAANTARQFFLIDSEQNSDTQNDDRTEVRGRPARPQIFS